jgi:hypothetical protein
MQLWVNWRTRITHLSRDCHQIQRIPEGTTWLEMEEGDVDELTNVGRRYCSWCVGRYLSAGERLAVVPSADLHPPAERADYGKVKVTPRQ